MEPHDESDPYGAGGMGTIFDDIWGVVKGAGTEVAKWYGSLTDKQRGEILTGILTDLQKDTSKSTTLTPEQKQALLSEIEAMKAQVAYEQKKSSTLGTILLVGGAVVAGLFVLKLLRRGKEK